MISNDYGSTWTISKLPFKVGGNMPGEFPQSSDHET